jgi:hypothetical protein
MLQKIELESICTYEDDNNLICLKDKELAELWREFHDQKAHYRLLCHSCNSHFGAYNNNNIVDSPGLWKPT